MIKMFPVSASHPCRVYDGEEESRGEVGREGRWVRQSG